MRPPTLSDLNDIRKKGLRPQVVGCILHQKKILFVYNERYDLWQLPQGGIDNRETLEEAAVREMQEELGRKFVDSIKETAIFLGEDRVDFSPRHYNARELFMDDGKRVEMKGKRYFFLALEAKTDQFDVEQTEFDDYEWLNYRQAKEMAKQIYQPGKRRTILRVLDRLREKGLL